MGKVIPFPSKAEPPCPPQSDFASALRRFCELAVEIERQVPRSALRRKWRVVDRWFLRRQS